MKAPLYSIEGIIVGELELPEVFKEEIRPDLIKRAVLSIISARRQPYGAMKGAGRQFTAEYIGMRRLPPWRRTINVGRARLPRTKDRGEILFGRVANVPQAVGGPRAHPPKVEKVWLEKINKKEKRKATRSAIAATAVPDLVKMRGHVVEDVKHIPLVVEDRLEEISSTKELKEVLKKLGVWKDVERAIEGTRRRAGKGKRRGRAKKVPKSVLIVVGENRGIYKAARNLPGVDVVEVRNLNAELLAPGARMGRLTIWTKSAIEYLEGKK
ncbi:MAG: 50S ribosomal protein L4 [Candidatus Diapherotrites archaeon]|nr:50S ribosomal protein L4 [Candidatus Diapherotrites archaeon]